jgi:hypothetical protein
MASVRSYSSFPVEDCEVSVGVCFADSSSDTDTERPKWEACDGSCVSDALVPCNSESWRSGHRVSKNKTFP